LKERSVHAQEGDDPIRIVIPSEHRKRGISQKLRALLWHTYAGRGPALSHGALPPKELELQSGAEHRSLKEISVAAAKRPNGGAGKMPALQI
jgi:hypothetical protein